MLLSNITFFIECVNLLRLQYERASPTKRKQLATFLKTWLFYNSTSKNIYWTGLSTSKGLIEKVKEHRYSNLATTKYLLENEVRFDNNADQILWVFERMQWNYTSAKENGELSKLQQYDVFYGRLNGNLKTLYNEAEIELIEEKKDNDFYSKLKVILSNLKPSKSIIVEVEIQTSMMKNFELGLKYAIQNLTTKVNYQKVPFKGFIIRSDSYADIYEAIQSGFMNNMKIEQLKVFSSRYGYKLHSNKGPYRLQDTFQTQPKRVFKILLNKTPVFLSTYNNTKYKIQLLNNIAEYNDANLYFFDSGVNLSSIDF